MCEGSSVCKHHTRGAQWFNKLTPMALTQIIAVPFWTATFWYGYGFCSHYKGSRVTGKSCISYISIRLTTKHQFMSSWVIRAIYRTDIFWMVLKICSMLKPLCGFWQRQACIVALKACIAHYLEQHSLGWRYLFYFIFSYCHWLLWQNVQFSNRA